MVKEILTSKGNYAIVDDEDYEWLSNHSWHSDRGYAKTNLILEDGKRKHLGMHRLIMNPPEDKEVDHINGIKHDNRRENLRIVTKSQNVWNIGKRGNPDECGSKYKGVTFVDNKYYASIYQDGVKRYLGQFNNELAAANAYNYYAEMFHGEYAKLNDVLYMSKEEWELYKFSSSSCFKGVQWNTRMNKWAVNYKKENGKHSIVYFEDKIIAANYYNHLQGEEINKCDYYSKEECESKIYKRSITSVYTGVSWGKSKNKWVSKITYQKKQIYIGCFDSERDAALAYNNKIIELGLDKNLNIIEQEKSL
jgi:hypothetical protein